MTHDTNATHKDQIELEKILSAEFQRRFYSYVSISDTGCHEWTGCVDRKGYGNIHSAHRKVRRAHRIAKCIELGRILDSTEHVCHSCDNRRCVNPAHLWIGSNADNVADMMSKGRNGGNIKCRDENASTKVSYAQIEQMRELKAAGVTVKEIAARFGLSPNYAGRLILYLNDGAGTRSARPAGLSTNAKDLRYAY